MENNQDKTEKGETAPVEDTSKPTDNKVNNESLDAKVSPASKRKSSESDSNASKAKKARVVTSHSVADINASLQLITIRLLIAQIDRETASLLAAATSIRERAGIRELRSMRIYDVSSACRGQRNMLEPAHGEWRFEVRMTYYDKVFSSIEDRWFFGRV